MGNSHRLRIPIAVLAIVFTGTFGCAGQVEQSSKPTEIFSQMKYRYIGPPGNRVTSVVGAPGDPNVYYAGAASGGVWKSTDSGSHWAPIFDAEPVQSIGAISIAPSNPSIVWVGTGEPWLRSNVSLGDGVYKSIDSGKTWTHMGWRRQGA